MAPGLALGRQLHLWTMQVLRGLEAIGVDYSRALRPAGRRVASHGAECGRRWGETCGSYDNSNTKGVGPSTPSQTAWAVTGLLAANDTRSDSVARGIAYYCARKRKTDRGTNLISLEQDFRGFFTCATTCIGSISRCSP